MYSTVRILQRIFHYSLSAVVTMLTYVSIYQRRCLNVMHLFVVKVLVVTHLTMQIGYNIHEM